MSSKARNNSSSNEGGVVTIEQIIGGGLIAFGGFLASFGVVHMVAHDTKPTTPIETMPPSDSIDKGFDVRGAVGAGAGVVIMAATGLALYKDREQAPQ